MFIGGYISAAGLGLICPDWPLCPNGIFPGDDFFIEWVHRLIAVFVGTMIIATNVFVWRHQDSDKYIKFTSTFASVLVLTQIGLGALVIDLQLQAILVAIHFGIGILLFSMVLLTTLFGFRLSRKSSITV